MKFFFLSCLLKKLTLCCKYIHQTLITNIPRDGHIFIFKIPLPDVTLVDSQHPVGQGAIRWLGGLVPATVLRSGVWSLTQFWPVRYEEMFAGGEGNLELKASRLSASG